MELSQSLKSLSNLKLHPPMLSTYFFKKKIDIV
jgi:hypothetical protein